MEGSQESIEVHMELLFIIFVVCSFFSLLF